MEWLSCVGLLHQHLAVGGVLAISIGGHIGMVILCRAAPPTLSRRRCPGHIGMVSVLVWRGLILCHLTITLTSEGDNMIVSSSLCYMPGLYV